MKNHPLNIIKLTLLTFVLLFGYSCSKDTDLIADYVVETPNTILANSIVTTLSNNPIVIDPLKDEVVVVPENVIITEVTPPTLGTAVVNDDNTITYTPDEDKSGTDEFDYTATVTNPDNSTTTATGNVTVNVGEAEKTQPDDTTGYVNFSTFGAVGDGKADDTKALQAALDAEGSLVADEGAIFRITGTLNINKPGDQTIDFNGAIVTASTKVSQAFNIAKPNGITNLLNLDVEGKRNIASAFFVRSQINATNVNVEKLYGSNSRSVAWRVEVSSNTASQGEYNFTDCDCTDVESLKNDKIGDMQGVSRCLWLRWLDTSSKTTVNVNGGIWDGAWGDDGDLIQVEQTTNDYIHDCKLIVTGTELKNFSRRAVKGTAANMEFYNVTFTSPLPSNPRLTSKVPSSGMATMSIFNITNYPNSTSRNHVFSGCTFNNPGGYEGRLIPSRAEHITVENCVFNPGTSIALNIRVGDMDICNNTFEENSSIYAYGSGGVKYIGEINIGSNNIAPSGFNKLPSGVWNEVSCQ
ncbi:Ig-like domain-containing protein [Arenibacter amylolyticus]|uniref:Ig-like domain-containing protein n=1 Tax=Arenibacter amylolyticus TaxID=1406873 RepID=UPI000A36FC3F|nr:Ig-like domain-containing protein [Arenibacter amylolyticus]